MIIMNDTGDGDYNSVCSGGNEVMTVLMMS